MSYDKKYQFAARAPRLLPSPWWIGHIPFAFQIVDTLKPRKIVELGVYNGASFLAFCQAVENLHLAGKCYGVDTWKGDIHMGEFEENLYKEISEYCKENYPNSAVLMRKTFDEAASEFKENSIDLLHIDGTHTYEAVSNDYHTWLPKMSKRGVVLFHDINVTYEMVGEAAKEFGVRDFFDSVKNQYPHFEFKHCYGLGVLIVGKDASPPVLKMVEEAKSTDFTDYFSQLGAKVLQAYEEQEKETQGIAKSNIFGLKKIIGSWARKMRVKFGS